MVRPLSLALAGLLVCATAVPADEAKRQQSIELLDQLLQRAVPTAQVKIIPGAGNSIILTGQVAHAEDIDTIMGIAHEFRGEKKGAIINALRVGGVQQVQLDVVSSRRGRVEVGEVSQVQLNVVLVRVDRAGLEQADPKLYRKYVECFWRLRTADEAGCQECLKLLQELRDQKHAKQVAEPKLVTLSGKMAVLQNGGEAAVPQVSGFGGDGLWHLDLPPGARIHFMPVVHADGSIELEIEPEVTQVNVEVIQGGGSVVFVPQNATKRLQTTIQLDDGQTVVHVMPGAFEEGRYIPAESATDLVLLATVHVLK